MAQDQKREAIIKAAQKRFAHFGVSKTTMNEIADDVSMSKASLYYYFPDKLNLYAAVIQAIVENEDASLKEYLNEPDSAKSIILYLEKRTEFLIKNYNILEYLRNLNAGIPNELKEIFSMARSRELKVVVEMIQKGIKSGVIKTDNPPHTAELFLDSLEGLRLSIISHKTNFFPDKTQFEAILKREKELAVIFFRGLAG